MQRNPRSERTSSSPGHGHRHSVESERPASQHSSRSNKHSRLPRAQPTPPLPTKPKWEPSSVTYRRSNSDIKSTDRRNLQLYHNHKSPSSPRSYPGPGNNRLAGGDKSSASDRLRHESLKQLPFGPSSRSQSHGDSTTFSSSFKQHKKYCRTSKQTFTTPAATTTSSMTSQHSEKKSYLPRRDSYTSKGINVNTLQPPPKRYPSKNTRGQLPSITKETAATSSTASTSREVSSFPEIVSIRKVTSNISEEEAATSRLRKLCIDIIQSARDGKATPQRSEIKEVVAEYHRSRNNAISPRDPNFVEIPSEFSKVLTFGMARSQTLLQTTTTIDTKKSQQQQDTSREKNPGYGVKAAASRSRFSEIKDEWEVEDPRLHTTVVFGQSDDVASCVSLPSIGEHSLK